MGRRLLEDLDMNAVAQRVSYHSQVPLRCLSCSSRVEGMCGALNLSQLEDLNANSQTRILEPGDWLIENEDDTRICGNILSGVMKLSKMMVDGRQQIVGLKFASEFLGRPFRSVSNVTAEAATKVRVCVFPKVAMERMISDSSELEHLLYLQTLCELDDAQEWMLMLGRKTASEKVACFLLRIARRSQVNGSSFELPLKRADIADFLGLTIETVSRQISKLRKARIIEVENNRTITVLAMSALVSASGSALGNT